MNKYLSNKGYGTLLIDLMYQHKNNNTHTEINIWESQNPDRIENIDFVTNEVLNSQPGITVNGEQRAVIDEFVKNYNNLLDKRKEKKLDILYEGNFLDEILISIENIRTDIYFKKQTEKLRKEYANKLCELK